MFQTTNINKKVLFVIVSTLTINASEVLKIDNNLELFIDNHGIESIMGDLNQVLIEPKPREIVFKADSEWEGSRSHYWNLFKDDNGFKMYYRCAGVVNRHIIQNSCMAESEDGIHWNRPELGLLWNGINTNMTLDGRDYDASNIIAGRDRADTNEELIKLKNAAHNLTVFKDTSPSAREDERYKAFGRDGISLSLLSSKDGKVWNKAVTAVPNNSEYRFDSQNLLFWDSTIGKYRAYWREYENGVRIISMATSSDAKHWSDASPLKYTTGTFSKEKSLASDYDNLYTNAIQPYFRNANLYIGFPTRFNPKNSQTEPILMMSREGKSFHRYLKPVISIHATPDRSSNRSNYMASGMFELPNSKNELSVYALEHYGYEDGGTRLRRFTYRTDGFVALRSLNNIGYLTTKTLSYKGNNLYINFVTKRDGYIRIKVLDNSGKVIGISKKMVGDFVDKPVVWDKKPSLSKGNVKVTFELKKCDLFSYKFNYSNVENQNDDNVVVVNSYKLEYVAGEHGEIEGETLQILTSRIDDGTEVTAVADAGYHFVHWSDGRENISRVDDAKNIKLIAVFEKDEIKRVEPVKSYRLEYVAGEHGEIEGETLQILTSRIDDGTEVIAVADAGYHFVHWSDGRENISRIDDAKNIKLIAVFEKDKEESVQPAKTYRLEYVAGEHGKIEGERLQILTSRVDDGTEVTAVADEGYHFVHWSDGKKSISRIDDAQNLKLIAIFEKDKVERNDTSHRYYLEYISGANGKIIGEQEQFLDSLSEDTTEVVAIADEGYHFVGWSDGKTDPRRFDDAKNMYVIAIFESNTIPMIENYPYRIEYSAGENGKIIGNQDQYLSNLAEDSTKVTARANEGYHFLRWSDGIVDPIRFDDAKNMSIFAVFEKNKR